MTETEKKISHPFSIAPSQAARIEIMAFANRKSFSELVRDLVMPQVEAWEAEQDRLSRFSRPDPNITIGEALNAQQ